MSMIFGISMKVADLLENEKALSVFDKLLPGMKDRAFTNPQAAQLSIEQVIKYARIPRADWVLDKLDEELDKLNTPENMISPSEAKAIEFFKSVWEADGSAGKNIQAYENQMPLEKSQRIPNRQSNPEKSGSTPTKIRYRPMVELLYMRTEPTTGMARIRSIPTE